MLGQAQIDAFWSDVERYLREERPDLTTEQRLRAILAYRNALASVDVQQMVYHREASEVARDIVAGEFVAA